MVSKLKVLFKMYLYASDEEFIAAFISIAIKQNLVE